MFWLKNSIECRRTCGGKQDILKIPQWTYFVEKSTSEEVLFSGWGGRIRTSECSSQSAVSYRLTTPQC